MPYPFYLDPKYKIKQAEITRQNWKSGIYNFRRNLKEERICKHPECSNTFFVKLSESKRYCSKQCSGLILNKGRVLSETTKQKISYAIKNLPKSKRGKHFTKPKISLICNFCNKTFDVVPYLSVHRKYCSVKCSSKTLGRLTTSPKASKGKNGIRSDIDPNINFYSTWEANIARVYILVGLKWQYAPKIFDLGDHTYRPDFYLPDFNTFIEVKNFMGEYSTMRDRLFRKKFPDLNLELILKSHYLDIRESYKDLVETWEN